MPESPHRGLAVQNTPSGSTTLTRRENKGDTAFICTYLALVCDSESSSTFRCAGRRCSYGTICHGFVKSVKPTPAYLRIGRPRYAYFCLTAKIAHSMGVSSHPSFVCAHFPELRGEPLNVGIMAVSTVASIAAVHGCGSVFIHRFRSRRVEGTEPSA